MSIRSIRRAAVLAALLLVLYFAFLRPRGYAGLVHFVRIVEGSESGSVVTDLWYDQEAHLLRVYVPTTAFTLYAHCPGQARCTTLQDTQTPPSEPPSDALNWATVLSSLLPLLPAPHQPPQMMAIDGVRQQVYVQQLSDAPSVEQLFWLDPATGAVRRYAEMIAGHLVSTETFTRSVLSRGTLPADFFAPASGNDPFSGLRTWIGNLHLP